MPGKKEEEKGAEEAQDLAPAVTETKTEVVEKPRAPLAPRDFLRSDSFLGELMEAAPTSNAFREVLSAARMALGRNPELHKCTPKSFCLCVTELASMGLPPDGYHASLIPRRSRSKQGNKWVDGPLECHVSTDYKGLVSLAYRSGIVSEISGEVIREGDDFEQNLGKVVKHTWDIGDEGRINRKLIGVWSIIKLKDGGEVHRVLSRAEVLKARAASPSWQAKERAIEKGWSANDTVWDTWEIPMWLKTAFRSNLKWVERSSALARAIAIEDEAAKEVAVATAKGSSLLGMFEGEEGGD